MRRPDVFTLNYNHPLAQGLVFARLEHKRDLGPQRLTGQSVDAIHGVDELGRKISSFNGTSGNGVIFQSPVPTMSLEPITISAWAMATETVVGADIIAFIHNPAVNYRYIALDFARINTTNKVSLRTRFGTGGEIVAYASAYRQSEWMHVIGEIIPSASQRIYADGVLGEQTSIPQQSALTATNLNLGTAMPFTSNNLTGSIGDVLIHNRALSPAEIALLADRTDPMLGGLIVEERPVLYFDMGGRTEVEGPAVITAASTISVSGSKQATSPVTITAVAEYCASGIKTILGIDKEGPAVITASATVGMGGVKGGVGAAVLGGDYAPTAGWMKGATGQAWFAAMGEFYAVRGPDDVPIAADEIGRAVSLQARNYSAVLAKRNYTARL